MKYYKGNVVIQPNNINKLKKTSEILTFHIRSISKDRLTKRIGKISEAEISDIKKCFDEIWRY